jgi:hypothetical protein
MTNELEGLERSGLGQTKRGILEWLKKEKQGH